MRRALGAAIAALLTLSACGHTSGSSRPVPPTGGTQPDPAPVLTTAAPPWPAPTGDVEAYVRKAGLTLLSSEGTAEHIHAHLDVIYDGMAVKVPADIGIDTRRSGISSLHTHDATGIVHIESPDVRPFTLGELFTEWGVSMTATCVGQCSPSHPVSVYVNGAKVDTPADQVVLIEHAEIVVAVGAPPASVASSYTFPKGY
ncbi:MAG: hypothetical protein NVS3B12_27380 [Acidimicrobiales bacterium]